MKHSENLPVWGKQPAGRRSLRREIIAKWFYHWLCVSTFTLCSVSAVCPDLSRWVGPQRFPLEYFPSWSPSGGRERRRGPHSYPGWSRGRWLWSWGRSPRCKPGGPHSPLWWGAGGRRQPRSPAAAAGGKIIRQRVSAVRRGAAGRARPEVVLHLDNGEHPLIIVQVGVDLEAARGIPFDDGVDGSPGTRGWVVPVVDRQVDHHARRALVDKRFKLRRQKRNSTSASKSNLLLRPWFI